MPTHRDDVRVRWTVPRRAQTWPLDARMRGPAPLPRRATVAAAGMASQAMAAPVLTHVGPDHRATMVDVSDKVPTDRTATAAGRVWLPAAVHTLVATHAAAKGDVLTVAQLAGIMGAKWTSTLIPLCHPLPLSKVDVTVTLEPPAADGSGHVAIRATARCHGRTGVEMEALTAVAVAALTVYDMVKAASHTVVVRDIHLVHKAGGASVYTSAAE